jgi:hypothetical protein
MSRGSNRQPVNRKALIIGGSVVGVLLVLGLALLLVIREVAVSKAVEALNKEVGPAASWRLGVGLFTPLRILLGMPVDAELHGTDVKIRGQAPVRSFDVVARGVQVDVGGRKLTSIDSLKFEAELGDQAVDAFLKQTFSSRVYSGVQVKFTGGKVVLNGTANLLVTSIPVTCECTPEIRPPSTVALKVEKFTDTNSGRELNVQSTFSDILARDLKMDLGSLLKGAKVDSCSVTEGGLRIVGSIDPQQLLGGGLRPPK